MLTELHAVHALAETATRSVRVVGVVPFAFPWDRLARSWTPRLASGTLKIRVACEADNYLFAEAFVSDTDRALPRRSFSDLRFTRDEALELPELLRSEQFNAGGVQLRVAYAPIPVAAVEIDGRFFIAPSLTGICDFVQEVTDDRHWRDAIEAYLADSFDGVRAKYAAAPDDEILELFDHNRVPRGIYPRQSFYDTDYSQLVVWGLIFDRRGRLLIHRRSANAKDNQDMWDKSVGGHVDFAQDVDTSRAVMREMIEELFHDEVKKQFRAFHVSDEDVVYLGEWRPQTRKRQPFLEISHYKQEWAFFRLRESQRVYTPRTLPDGRVRRLRVIADVYLFAAGPALRDELLDEMKNSQYKLIHLADLKSAMDRALRGDAVDGFDTSLAVPKFTPDLTNIMTGELRDVMEDFAQHVRRYLA